MSCSDMIYRPRKRDPSMRSDQAGLVTLDQMSNVQTPRNKPQPFETSERDKKATTARDISPSNTPLSPCRSLGAVMNVLATALLKI